VISGALPVLMAMSRTILLVDDDQDLRDVFVAMLSEPGNTILTASTGYEALRILVERSVDLLLTLRDCAGLDPLSIGIGLACSTPNHTRAKVMLD
jgi:CheY-like chemotaxis protein